MFVPRRGGGKLKLGVLFYSNSFVLSDFKIFWYCTKTIIFLERVYRLCQNLFFIQPEFFRSSVSVYEIIQSYLMAGAPPPLVWVWG